MTYITMSNSQVRDLATKRLLEKAASREGKYLSMASANENRCRRLLVLAGYGAPLVEVHVDDYYALVVSEVKTDGNPQLEGYGNL